jgi:16S rRNA (guanine966-N2)-methyltransferase
MHRTMSGLAFLDLYAGSGAVGLEAASRGAARTVLVESDQHALTTLRRNVSTLAIPGVEVVADRVERFLAGSPAQTFDIAFVDPPYQHPVDDVLSLLAGNGWLSPEATVVVERATKSDPLHWPAGWGEDRARRYGDSTLWYGRRP